jgi:hypothetical protein
MQSKQLLIVVGASSALVLGVLAGLLWPRAEDTTAVVPPPVQRTAEERASLVQRLSALRDDIPEEKQSGERFMAERWGHMGGTDVLMGVDMNGSPYHIDPKLYVGRGRGGERLYARAIATFTTIPEENLMRRDELQSHLRVEGRQANTREFRPNLHTLRRLQTNYAPIDNPDDLPDDVTPRVPGYGG